jgi:hypothetical protein
LIVVSLKSHHQATRMFTLLSSIQSVRTKAPVHLYD